jgi:thiamine-monophosphate kinase
VVTAQPRRWANILGGGDDYELLIAAPSRKRRALLRAAHQALVKVTRIGCFTLGRGVHLTVAGQEMRVPRKGYVHF